MIRITQDISEKFQCSNCGGFLNSKPVKSGPNNAQICALCYELLSDKDKKEYVSQTVFERVADIFIFPCRYRNSGCKFEYRFGQNFDHEKTCRFQFENEEKLTTNHRHRSDPEVHEVINYFRENRTDALESQNSVSATSDEIKLEVDFREHENFYVNGAEKNQRHLRYSFQVNAEDGYVLTLKNLEKQTEKSYATIISEGILSFEFPTTTTATATSAEDSFMNNLKVANVPVTQLNTSRKVCDNCQDGIEKDVYHCLFGHDACRNCKGKTCVLCQTSIMGKSKSYCRNRHKGCSVLENSELLLKHEIDCEYNNFRCPFPRCGFLNNLSDLKHHVLISHNNNIIRNNQISENAVLGKRDKKWYVYFSDNIFVCTYYYFVTNVEFIVAYVGSNDNAKLYQFEVDISNKLGRFKKKSVCAGWNEVALCQGIQFECKHLTDAQHSKLQFNLELKISQNTVM